MQARFSLPYCAAVAVLQGAVTVADFTPEAVARPEVRAWLPNVTLKQISSDTNLSCRGHIVAGYGFCLQAFFAATLSSKGTIREN